MNSSKAEFYTSQDLEDSLYRHLQRRQLPDCFLYTGQSGAQTWLDLEQSEDFPVASSLTNLLSHHVDSIAAEMPTGCDVVSIGVGAGSKERLLLEALLPDFEARYIAVDVSSELVDRALETVDDLDVDARGVVAFFEDLPDLRPRWDSPFLLCLLGNNFCNYHPDELLQNIFSQLSQEDLFLVDAHLRPEGREAIERWSREIDSAYGSERNARFNLQPLLTRGMDRAACDFNIGLTEVQTSAGSACRTRKHIRIREHSTLAFGNKIIELEPGETIEMGFTYKYTKAQLRELLASAGFRVVMGFRDGEGEHALVLVEPR